MNMISVVVVHFYNVMKTTKYVKHTKQCESTLL